jgi:hypothetical protein
VLQDASPSLRTGVTDVSVRAFVRAGCLHPLAGNDIERWRAAVPDLEGAELWLIGPESIARAAADLGARPLAISDVIEPSPRTRNQVRVRVPAVRGERAREAVLDLPPARLTVQLLRDPFGSAAAKRVAAPPEQVTDAAMAFSPDGRRLYVRTSESTLTVFKVPNSPRGTAGRPVSLTVPADNRIVGVGRSPKQKQALLLTEWGESLFLHVLSKSGASIVRSEPFVPGDDASFPVYEPANLRPIGALQKDRYCLIGADGELIELFDGRMRVDRRVQAFAAVASTNLFGWASIVRGAPRISSATTRRVGAGWSELAISKSLAVPDDLPPVHGDERLLFGADNALLFAYRVSAESWLVTNAGRREKVDVPHGHAVAGVFWRPTQTQSSGPVLAALDETRMRLEHFGPGGSELLLTTAAPVRSICADTASLAYLTEAGEVGVYSFASAAIVMRSSVGASP